MDIKQDNVTIALNNFLDAYNECWYNKDLEKLKDFYDYENDRLIYFDNHTGNDTYTVNDHLKLISNFFENGKSTESGSVEPLIIENLNTFHFGDAACLCYIAKYESHPTPAIRCTLYLEYKNDAWKILFMCIAHSNHSDYCRSYKNENSTDFTSRTRPSYFFNMEYLFGI